MMDNAAFFSSVLVMAVTTYLIRMLPLAVIRGNLRSPFLRAFLRFVPYAVLGAMTFPAVFTSAGSMPASLCGLAVGLWMGWMEKGLLAVALSACAAAYLAGLFLG